MLRALRPLACVALMAACTDGQVWRDRTVELTAPTSVDLSRYAGRWFEIARFPNRFEENCTATTQDFRLRDDGRLDMAVTCRVATLAGPVRTYTGTARVISESNAEWKLDLNPWVPWFFDGGYVILAVSDDYDVAVVGTPEGTAGWVLGRTYRLSDDDIAAAYRVLEANGYEMWNISLVDQPGVGN